MHLLNKASIGLLLLISVRADVYDPYYAQASQQQPSYASISSSSKNTVGGNGGRPQFQSVASFSGHNNGQHFGGTILNNNGQVTSQIHPGHKTQYSDNKASNYKTSCTERGKICAPRNYCQNGLVRSDQLSFLDDTRSECVAGEVCCKIYYDSQPGKPFQAAQTVRCRSGNQKCVPAYQCVNGELTSEGLQYAARLLPASSCANGQVCCAEARAYADSEPAAATNQLTPSGYVIPTPDRKYLPSLPDRPDEIPEQSGGSEQSVPTQPPRVPQTQRPTPRPTPARTTRPPSRDSSLLTSDTNALSTIVGCAAAMNCTPRIMCDATATISKTGPVQMTPEQELFRVPMTECRIKATGEEGVCCRDSDYTDPWPVAILGQYRPDLLGFDDGSWKPEKNSVKSAFRASASQHRPQKVRPNTPIRRQASPNSIFQEPQVKTVCGRRDRNSEPRGPTEINSNFGEIPWQVMVARESTKTLLCGGVIISQNIVLASAKCVQGVRPNDIVTKVGEWQLGSDIEPRPFQIMHVRSVQTHPQFNPSTLEYDIAVIYLSESIRFDRHIAPICLDANENGGLENCITTGWGKDVLRVHAKDAVMQYTDAYAMSPETCADYLQTYGFNPQSSICGHTKIDSCLVDTGSALACQRSTGDYVLKGIYSTETGCNSDSQILTFTKIDQWVRNAINGNTGRSRF